MNAIYLWLWAPARTGTPAQPHCLRTRYSVRVHVSSDPSQSSHCVGTGSPGQMGPPNLDPECRKGNAGVMNQLDKEKGHIPASSASLSLMMNRCLLGGGAEEGGKGFGFLRLLSKPHSLACAMWNGGDVSPCF